METKEKFFNNLRKKKLRITRARKAMIEVLQDNHLTFKEIKARLFAKGYTNVSTIYNNIDFLLEHKIAVELYINDTKYYDLAIDNPAHNADSHIHVVIKDTNKIYEVSNNEIFEFIKTQPEFAKLDLEYIRITIAAKKQHHKNK